MTAPAYIYPDGNYLFVHPEGLRTGDIIRICHHGVGILATVSEPVTFISKPIQTGGEIIVETIPDSEDHVIFLGSVSILRREQTLPTENGATIFIDELVGDAEHGYRISLGTLAQYSKIDGLWNWFDQRDSSHCDAPSTDIKAWRLAYVTDKAPDLSRSEK